MATISEQRQGLQMRIFALRTEIDNTLQLLARLHDRLEAALDELALLPPPDDDRGAN